MLALSVLLGDSRVLRFYLLLLLEFCDGFKHQNLHLGVAKFGTREAAP